MTAAGMKRLEEFIGPRPVLYGGKHAKSCKCNLCTRAKLAEYEARVKLAIRGGARIESADQTVPVRSHFRAQPNHLKSNPELRKMVREIVLSVLAEQRKHQS